MIEFSKLNDTNTKICPQCKNQSEIWANLCQKCGFDYYPRYSFTKFFKEFVCGLVGLMISITCFFLIVLSFFAGALGDGSGVGSNSMFILYTFGLIIGIYLIVVQITIKWNDH